MVRLKGRDDLDDKAGRLSLAFGSAILGTLYKAFSAAATDKAAATQALEHFRKAALALHSSENAFNKRARRVGNSVMNHLRDGAQLAAVRDFHAAREDMFSINDKVGRSIATIFAQGAGSAAPQQRRSPSPQELR